MSTITDRAPLRWWEIAGRADRPLPFSGFFNGLRRPSAALNAETMITEDEMRTEHAMETTRRAPRDHQQALWGRDNRLIEEWFAAGESLDYDLDWELRYGASTAWEEY